MRVLRWWENRSSLFRATVYFFMQIGGLFMAIAGGKLGAVAAVILYSAGWLSRHTQNPKAGNILDPERHPVMDYHD